MLVVNLGEMLQVCVHKYAGLRAKSYETLDARLQAAAKP